MGVSSTGFSRRTTEQIRTSILTKLRANISPSIGSADDDPLVQIVTIFAEMLAAEEEEHEATYNSQYPSGATGVSLERLCALTGTTRQAATKSTVTASINLDAGVTVSIGALTASVSDNPDAQFVNTESVTNSGGSPANFDIDMEATETGPTQALSGTLTVIDTPIVGLNSITNALDATVGTNIESDADLRARRLAEIDAQGGGTQDSIQARLAQLDGVLSVAVQSNRTAETDSRGLPPNSIRAVVLGGAAQEIVDTIWEHNCAGIETYGTSSGTATDNEGDTHTVYYQVPTEKTVYLEIDVDVDSDSYPSDGDTQIAQAIADFTAGVDTYTLATGRTLDGTTGVGEDLILSKLYTPICSIAGVVDVTALRADFSASPVATANLAIDDDEYIGNGGAVGIDTSTITVASTAV